MHRLQTCLTLIIIERGAESRRKTNINRKFQKQEPLKTVIKVIINSGLTYEGHEALLFVSRNGFPSAAALAGVPERAFMVLGPKLPEPAIPAVYHLPGNGMGTVQAHAGVAVLRIQFGTERHVILVELYNKLLH